MGAALHILVPGILTEVADYRIFRDFKNFAAKQSCE